MHARFAHLGAYAFATGADAILFTCSAFGPCIEAVAHAHAPKPVLKPNEAMIDAAVQTAGAAGRIGLVATFAPTLRSMPAEFPPGTALETALAAEALAALDRGDTTGHDRLAAEAALQLKARGCTLIALAQFSLARAAPAVRAATGLPVLTTVDSAVAALRRRLASSG
jgi:aspartate/glutamate racemase